MAIGEINEGLSGGQEAMRKVAEHSDNVNAKLGLIAGRLLTFAETIEGINQSLAHLRESDEAVSVLDSARVVDEEAQTAFRAISSRLEGADNPQATLITGMLGAIAEEADIAKKNAANIFAVTDDYILEQLTEVTAFLRDVSANYFSTTAEEASLQAGLARTTAEEMGKYVV